MKKHLSGFSLPELMIAVAIVGILATLALSNNSESQLKAKRAIAKNALLEVQSRQEQYYINNRMYSTGAALPDTLTPLGYTNPYFINSEGRSVPAGDPGIIYQITIATVVNAGADYIVTATPPAGSRQDADECGALSIENDGTRTALKGGNDVTAKCW